MATNNTHYTAKLSIKQEVIDSGLIYVHADNLDLILNYSDVSGFFENDGDNLIVYAKFPKTDNSKLLSVSQPASITVTYGTAVSSKLPATVKIKVEDNSVTTASVIWGATGFDANTTAAQSLTIKGTVTLPSIISNPNGVSLEVTQRVYVEGAARVATPTVSLPAGTYENSEIISLHTDTEEATIYYTTDGSAPTAFSSVYTAPIELTKSMTVRAVAVKGNGFFQLECVLVFSADP